MCWGQPLRPFHPAHALFLSVALLFSGAAHAGDAAPETISAGKILRGHFVQERKLSGFANALHTEGEFVLVPGTGLIWRAQKPFANTTVITPDGILQYVNGSEAMRLTAAKVPGLSHLYDVLDAAVSGNIAPLRRAFSVSQSSGADTWRLVLTPLDPGKAAAAALKSVTLTGNRFVDTAEVDEGGGDVDRMTFLDQNIASADLSAGDKALLGALHK